MPADTAAVYARSKTTAYTGRERSPAVWNGCPFEQIRSGLVDGVALFDDFTAIGGVSSTITTEGTNFPSEINWSAFGSPGATHLVTGSSAAQNGTVTLGSDGDDEASVLHQFSAPFKIAVGQGSLWYECRFKLDTVAVTKYDFFCGLIEYITATPTVPITATGGTMADKNFIGFQRAATGSAATGDAGSLRVGTYKTDGNAVATVATVAGALVADTYIKTAFVFSERDNKIRFFLDNVLQTSTYTVTSTAGNPFPNDVTMGLCLATCNAAANGSNAIKFTVDWIRCVQVAPSQGFLPNS